jgi:hypothetical protein
MTIGDQAQVAGIGTYCWNTDPASGQGIGLCVDKLGIMTPLEALVVAPGPVMAQFHLPLDRAPSLISLQVMPANGEPQTFAEEGIQAWRPEFGEGMALPLEIEPSVTLELEPGLHVLALFVQWEGVGDVMYGFLLQAGEGQGGGAFTLPASCVPADQSLAPYVDPGGRYCLLFPNSFRIGDVTMDRANFYGPPLDQSIEPLFAMLAIQVAGPAEGRGLTEVVDAYVAENGLGQPVTRRAITLGGEPAEVVEGLPGRLLYWQAFVVHGGLVYHLTLSPKDPAVPQTEPDAQAAWQALEASFAFLE